MLFHASGDARERRSGAADEVQPKTPAFARVSFKNYCLILLICRCSLFCHLSLSVLRLVWQKMSFLMGLILKPMKTDFFLLWLGFVQLLICQRFVKNGC
jgi:hypothetical protein